MIPLRDEIPSRRFPLVMTALILANVVVFLYEVSVGPAALKDLFATYGVVPERLRHALSGSEAGGPAATTLFTSMFLHGGWLHLIGNMWYLWIFGDNVEDRMGHGRFLAFYLLGGVAASLVHILSDPLSGIPSVGASGAIAAVLGAYLLTFPTARVVALVPIFFFLQIIELPALLVLGFWFVAQLFSGLGSLAVSSAQAQGGVAYWAHIGGFVFGIVALPFFRERRRSPWTHDGERPWPF
ncbi:MAG: rhomboid family intramembrane serine protease [Armatimonadetes bacterium]|nr:rhomboid family intramembrane serine protease [Armatimonadota bacterium]